MTAFVRGGNVLIFQYNGIVAEFWPVVKIMPSMLLNGVWSIIDISVEGWSRGSSATLGSARCVQELGLIDLTAFPSALGRMVIALAKERI